MKKLIFIMIIFCQTLYAQDSYELECDSVTNFNEKKIEYSNHIQQTSTFYINDSIIDITINNKNTLFYVYKKELFETTRLEAINYFNNKKKSILS